MFGKSVEDQIKSLFGMAATPISLLFSYSLNDIIACLMPMLRRIVFGETLFGETLFGECSQMCGNESNSNTKQTN